MTKTKEENELEQIWHNFACLDFMIESLSELSHREKYDFYKFEEREILLFWNLKQKIDDLKKQVERLEEAIEDAEDIIKRTRNEPPQDLNDYKKEVWNKNLEVMTIEELMKEYKDYIIVEKAGNYNALISTLIEDYIITNFRKKAEFVQKLLLIIKADYMDGITYEKAIKELIKEYSEEQK